MCRKHTHTRLLIPHKNPTTPSRNSTNRMRVSHAFCRALSLYALYQLSCSDYKCVCVCVCPCTCVIMCACFFHVVATLHERSIAISDLRSLGLQCQTHQGQPGTRICNPHHLRDVGGHRLLVEATLAALIVFMETCYPARSLCAAAFR